jgi:hypothetical protein
VISEDESKLPPQLMVNRLEDKIRDYLATRLDLLEPGLTLFQKEFVLNNPAGVGGRIDIVAKDKFGHFVIIELKRSNQAGRHALNEIHKYTALFRIQHGLDQTQVRIMVVSTEWEEMRIPLSECVNSFPYTVEGFAITAQNDGVVTHAERITLLPSSGLMRVSRMQGVYLFEKASDRDGASEALISAVTASGISDFFAIRMDYSGRDPNVCFRHGLYLAFASPLSSLPTNEVERLKANVEWDDELDQPDENFLVSVNRLFIDYHTFEIGYPEKLTNIRNDWGMEISIREGRFAIGHSLLTGEELLMLAQAVEGGSPIYLYKLSSPKFDAAWNELLANIKQVLPGMSNWQEFVPPFLEQIARDHREATVSVSIYNPANLIMSLYELASAKSLSKFAHLEIVVEEASAKRVRIIFSALSWNGIEIRETASELIEEVFGDFDDWLGYVHFHQTFEREDQALAAHNLTVPIVELVSDNRNIAPPQIFEIRGSVVQRRPVTDVKFHDMFEFANKNSGYLASLKELLEDHIVGLPGSAKFNV